MSTPGAAVQRLHDALEEHELRPRRQGDGFEALCPAHGDRKPSLTFGQGQKGAVLTCQTGCETGVVVEALGLTMSQLFDDWAGEPVRAGGIVVPDLSDVSRGAVPQAAPTARTAEAAYDYVDERGAPLFQVRRWLGKRFSQHAADGRGGWERGLGQARRVLYRLPRVGKAVEARERIWIVEGEKDVHAAESLGLFATTAPGGAGKWRGEYTESLRGARVVIVADCDEPGRKGAARIVDLLAGAVVDVRVIDLDPQRTDGYDLADEVAEHPESDRKSLRDLLERTADLSMPRGGSDRMQHPAQLAERVRERLVGRRHVDAWPFPFETLTELTGGGMYRGEVTYLGAPTSHGKTAMLDMMLDDLAPVVVCRLYTNEMADEDRLLRRVARETLLNFADLRRSRVQGDDLALALRSLDRFATDGYPIVAAAGMSAEEIRRDILAARPDVAVVDILHEIAYEGEEDLRRIARTLTLTAREAHCHLLVAVHLNDARHGGAYPPPPALRDIKGASAIRQGADNVLLLYREEDQRWDGEKTGDPGPNAVIHVAKARNGVLGRCKVTFEGKHMRFVARDEGRMAA